MRANVFVPVALLAGATAAWAADTTPGPRSGNDSLQRALYGAPREATLGQMLEAPADFVGRAVVLRGRFTRARSRGQFQLGTEPQAVRIEPSPAVAARVRARAPGWMGQDVEVVGVLLRDRTADDEGPGRGYFVRFWQYRAPETPLATSNDVPAMSLEDLVYSGGKADGKPVRVIGQFRGSNLQGDLPPVSRLRDSDWVIKEDFYAVWITGHGADGDGFDLDPLTLADQENWVEIVGKPETRDGITYLKAQRVSLTEPPAGASTRHTPARSPLAAIPPALVFTLPVNGEEGAPPDVRLVLQFNKSMDEASFAGRVRLRSASEPEALEDLRLAYDENKHALVVEPKHPLPPGRELILELMDGIIDVHGLALSRGRANAKDAFEAVRFRVAG